RQLVAAKTANAERNAGPQRPCDEHQEKAENNDPEPEEDLPGQAVPEAVAFLRVMGQGQDDDDEVADYAAGECPHESRQVAARRRQLRRRGCRNGDLTARSLAVVVVGMLDADGVEAEGIGPGRCAERRVDAYNELARRPGLEVLL